MRSSSARLTENLPMLLPYNVDVPMERMPIANWVLIGVTVLISLGSLFKQLDATMRDRHELERLDRQLNQTNLTKEQRDQIEDELDRRIAKLTEAPPLSLRPGHFSIFNLFSYQFAHGDLLHLAGNMLFLFVFGNAVNAKLGQGLFLLCYLLLGAVAGIAWLILGNGMPMVGASGAIMGIVGIFLILYPANDVSVLYFGFAGGGSFSFSAGWLILFYLASDLYGCLSGGGGAVAYIAHLGGAAGGAALAVVLLRTRVVRSSSYEKNLLQYMGVDNSPPRRKKRKKRKPPTSEVRGGWDPVDETGDKT